MEYWVWRNDTCLYLNGTVQKIKSDHNPLLIPKIPLFSPIRRLCEPEANIPLFQGFMTAKPPLRGEAKAWSSGPGFFIVRKPFFLHLGKIPPGEIAFRGRYIAASYQRTAFILSTT
jgi:hypothetical protein